MKKLRISQIFSKLEVTKPIIDYIAHMHNFIVKFGKRLGIYKKHRTNFYNKGLDFIYIQVSELRGY